MVLIPTLLILALQPEQPIVVEADRLRNDQATTVCKSERRANSRFQDKKCRTKAEWEAVSRENRKAWDEIRNRPFIPASSQ